MEYTPTAAISRFMTAKEKHLETAGMQVYQKSLGIAARLGRKQRMSKAFINVDSEWAKEILHRYQRYGFDE